MILHCAQMKASDTVTDNLCVIRANGRSTFRARWNGDPDAEDVSTVKRKVLLPTHLLNQQPGPLTARLPLERWAIRKVSGSVGNFRGEVYDKERLL